MNLSDNEKRDIIKYLEADSVQGKQRLNTPLKRKILVGMSGGVDSSVSAALLLREGHAVVGGFMKNWSDSKNLWTGECAWREERRDAMRVAAKLGIPLLTFDFEEAYRALVVNELFRGYEAGETPNPDVLCNEAIKFGLFFDEAMRLGFDAIATGHYAQIVRREPSVRLFRGADSEKDQSYFLYRVPQHILRRTLYPLGGLKKPQVRELARSVGIPTSDKPDSQGVCFIGKLDFVTFLRKKIPARQGEIVDEHSRVLGQHQGLDAYTIGQRQRINISGASHGGVSHAAWYVAEKDVATNQLVVVQGADHPCLYTRHAIVHDLHWTRGTPPATSFESDVQVRYRQEPIRARVKEIADKKWQIQFVHPMKAVAPGQSAVFYHGEECLGGGIIARA